MKHIVIWRKWYQNFFFSMLPPIFFLDDLFLTKINEEFFDFLINNMNVEDN
jgi:hypothetical protein